MKRLQIVSILIGLFVISLAIVPFVSASPINPPSVGCQGATVHATIPAAGYTHGPVQFYDEDLLHIVTSVPVTVHYSNNFGLNHTINNVTTLDANLPHTGLYTYSITPMSNTTFQLDLTCVSTPLSRGCITSNGTFTHNLTFTRNYDHGEQVHILANGPVRIVESGTVSATYPSVTNQLIGFAQPGSYTIQITILPNIRGVAGAVSCTLPGV